MAKKREEKTPNFTWVVHINEDFVTEVDSPNVEGAIMLAFAELYAQKSDIGLMAFEITVANKTLYEAQMALDKMAAQETAKR